VYCFNNWRVLHGRKEFQLAPGSEGVFERGYIGWDELHSKRRLLKIQFGISDEEYWSDVLCAVLCANEKLGCCRETARRSVLTSCWKYWFCNKQWRRYTMARQVKWPDFWNSTTYYAFGEKFTNFDELYNVNVLYVLERVEFCCRSLNDRPFFYCFENEIAAA